MDKRTAMLEYQNQLGERLSTELFPNEFLPKDYKLYKDAALFNVSLAFIQQNFGIDWEEYKQILIKERDYTLYEINLINAVILSKTPNEIGLTNYMSIIDDVEAMRAKYDAIVKPIQESIQKRIEIMSAPKGAYKETPVKFIN